MRLDKAPDAFRTISEVADDLDIPQHVLRFWETRFAQIKPMKRSGGRRYYRPDDIDLLRGIRRLLYGEGYTIRGVQRILKEQGVKAVQALASDSTALQPRASPGAARHPATDEPAFDHDDAELLVETQDLDDDDGEEEPDQIAEPPMARREPVILRPATAPPNMPASIPASIPATMPPSMELPAAREERRQRDRDQIEKVLQELLECKRILVHALETHGPVPATFEHLLNNPPEVKDKNRKSEN
jgi:DNA-binding transcriptional MerR regulator